MGSQIAAAEAVKHFAGQNIEVQTVKRVMVRGEDGRERPGSKAVMVPLRAEHVLGASDAGGSVTIVTIDGRRHTAAKRADKAPDKA